MKPPIAIHLAVVLAAAVPASARAETETFDGVAVGGLPSGWVAGVTGRGAPRWQVIDDASAPSPPHVLGQLGSGTFPWAVRDDVSLLDGFVQTRFKPIAGKADQAGGVVWRFRDAATYYVARANANEDNVALYHTVRGIRTPIKSADTPVARGTWHTLRVEFRGARIRVLFDGRVVIEADDTQIARAGAVGVWTKADSITSFDDFSWGTDGGTR